MHTSNTPTPEQIQDTSTDDTPTDDTEATQAADAAAPDATGTDNAGGEGGPTTFTQEQVNDIVAKRLAREDAKYADYDQLKEKAAQADALQEQLDRLSAENERQRLVSQIANEKGVPAALLQNAGDTAEEITQAADALLEWKGDAKAPSLPAVGGDPDAPAGADWVGQLFATL